MDLQAWLKREKLTDAAFAVRLGCNQTTINRIRRGISIPSRGLIQSITAETGGEVQGSDLINKALASQPASAA